MIPRCDQGTTGKDSVAVDSFLDVNAAVPVQAIGKGAGEDLGHVLDDYDTGTPGGHRLQKFAKSGKEILSPPLY